MCVQEALSKPPLSTSKQPVLFQLQDKYYVKLDLSAVEVNTASCFSDAVEFMLMIHYVFNLCFDYELKPTFGFLEKVLGIPVTIGTSSALTDLLRFVRW